MGFFRQENWSGLPFPSPGDFELLSPVSWADSLALTHLGSPKSTNASSLLNYIKTQIQALSDSLSSLKKWFRSWDIPLKKNKLLFILKIIIGTSLVIQWLRLWTSAAGVWVQFLAWEPKSHMPHGMGEKKNHYLNLYWVLHVPASSIVREPPNRSLSC